MAQFHFRKHFELSDADAWIPRLRSLFAKIHSALELVSDDVEALRSQVDEAGGNGGGVATLRYFSQDQAIDEALEEIQQAGIVIQDVARGLVDFPHIKDGREVLLCWQLDDGDTLEWYHEVQAGFAGRRPLKR